MSEQKSTPAEIIPEMTGIITAFVSTNAESPQDLPALMASVHQTLLDLANEEEQPNVRPEPAAPIKKSVIEQHIICLEDGKKLKMLKRYLRTCYNMSPEEYRARWGLPSNYPMVAPEYAKRRSKFAKETGLGRASS